MSVLTFGPKELANVAAVILNNVQPGRRIAADVTRVCEQLACISRANVACFVDKYGPRHDVGDTKAATVEEIRDELYKDLKYNQFKADFKSACSTAHLFHYNCDDEGGDFSLKLEDGKPAQMIISVLQQLMSIATERAS